MTGSGSRKSAPPAATDTSRRCLVVVVAGEGLPGAPGSVVRTAALTPSLALNTFVDPCVLFVNPHLGFDRAH